MANDKRDNFSAKTRLQIAKRAGWLCSYPPCRESTIGATSDGEGEIDLGEACHICAAAPGGPRYDASMSQEERSSPNNGIWMCRLHARAIDSTDPEFTVEQLQEWKRQAQRQSWQRVLRLEQALTTPAATNAKLGASFKAATAADLDVFRQTVRWPPTPVELILRVEGFDEPVTTRALAEAAVSLDDLVLIAPPGMGKTTTLFQIAEGILARNKGAPIFVSLGDWAPGAATILESVLQRPAFRGISEDDFRAVAIETGVVILLDGWNELDAAARGRARVQIVNLQAELPGLGLVVSTRRQALDIPFIGTKIDLLPLNETQQEQIAVAMRGDAGHRIVDQAWRTPGIRELMQIPLYLRALLSLPEGVPFPVTKEEVIRRFVDVHESEPRCAEDLRRVAHGLQQAYMTGLAAFATPTANSAIADVPARRSISQTAAGLVAAGDISIRPEPIAVLDMLVSSHVVTRTADPPGYSFQHQQFQEWYASHFVEHRILAEIDDPMNREKLKAEVFDLPSWEEPILFAVERMARGNADERAACGKAIVAAFEVDPLLAAEMIFRSTDQVWGHVGRSIQKAVRGWHQDGAVDRALRFMLTSGRPEFLDSIWPLISHEDDQISLQALRNCNRFRVSVLGSDAVQKIVSLPEKLRKVLLEEIAFHSGIDGLDLATEIAKSDPSPEVQASVVEALAFRQADRHVEAVLREASDATFDLITGKGIVGAAADAGVRERLAAATQRREGQGIEPIDRLRDILQAPIAEEKAVEVAAIIAEMAIGPGLDMVAMARRVYPAAVAEGLLARVRADRQLPHNADDVLSSLGIRLEDEELFQIAVADLPGHQIRMDAAASVLGPEATGRVIDLLLEVESRVRVGGQFNQAASDAYSKLLQRVAHISGESLVAAVIARSNGVTSRKMALFAHLLYRRPGDDDKDRGRPFNIASLSSIQDLIQSWGDQMLASEDATRQEKADIASLASCTPAATLLPILKRLLDDNLRRYQAFRDQATADGWRHGAAVNEARHPCTAEYKRAFLTIVSPETTALMREYLPHPHFGVLAAEVMAEQWEAANIPPGPKRFGGGIDFSGISNRRAARTARPDKSTEEADAIFAVVESLFSQDLSTDQLNLALGLGIVAARLPHGRRDATIQRLITLAPRRSRSAMLLSLAYSGEVIDIQDVAAGIAETFEAAKKESWILTQSEGFELKVWLQLLPFTNRPMEALPLIRSLPDAQRDPRFLEAVVTPLAEISSGQELLLALADGDPRFYRNYLWLKAALPPGTRSSAMQLIDAVARGHFDGQPANQWPLSQELANLIAAHPEVRAHVYELLKDGPTSLGLMLLARAVCERPDVEGLLRIVKFEGKGQGSFINFRTVQRAVTEEVPSENWQGAFDVVPIPAVELRKQLLALSTDGGPADAAARFLNSIDRIRDEYGTPMKEPRHPDLSSGRSWPIIPPAAAVGSAFR